MIQFELDFSGKGVEVVLDSDGVDELISYLIYIKEKKEHFHLTAGNELTEDSAREKLISHVKLAFIENP